MQRLRFVMSGAIIMAIAFALMGSSSVFATSMNSPNSVSIIPTREPVNLQKAIEECFDFNSGAWEEVPLDESSSSNWKEVPIGTSGSSNWIEVPIENPSTGAWEEVPLDESTPWQEVLLNENCIIFYLD